MKKILITFVTIILLLVYNNSYAGCFYNESKISIIKTFPISYCIDARSVSGCLGNISLFIGIKCDKEFYVFDENNRDLGLHPGIHYSGYNIGYDDYTISQEYNTSWVRKLVNKNNLNEIYYIKGKNYHIGYIVIKNIIYFLLILFGIWFLYKKLYTKRIKYIKRFIKIFHKNSGKILGYSSLSMFILLTIVQSGFVLFYEYIDKIKLTLNIVIFLNKITFLILSILIITSLISLIIRRKKG